MRFKNISNKLWKVFCSRICLHNHYPMKRLGSDYGGWTFGTQKIEPNSIIYSFGIGKDITFDLALIESYNCSVFAFDPTPQSIDWLKQQPLPEQYKWFEFGIADYDGKIVFYAPENPDFISHSIIKSQGNQHSMIVEVKKLQTIMKMFGHQRIDVLKMDIEGAEYSVLNNILSQNIPVSQILVEFHHFLPNISILKTIISVIMLWYKGYELFAISPSGHEYSFINQKFMVQSTEN
jgi:FkbM family methyltransferase